MTTYAIMVLAALAGGIIQPLTGFGSAVILMVAGQYFFDMTVAPSVAASGQRHSPLRRARGAMRIGGGVRAPRPTARMEGGAGGIRIATPVTSVTGSQ